jgi:hypothetical protein
VSLICNLARLSDAERETLRLAAGQNSVADFRALPVTERLIQFVRMEKPYFKNIPDRVDLKKYFFVYPTKNNKRIIAQSGAFVVSGLLQYLAFNTTHLTRLPKSRYQAEPSNGVF